MFLEKLQPKVRSPTSKSSAVKAIPHGLDRHSCSSSLEAYAQFSPLTDRDLKTEVHRK